MNPNFLGYSKSCWGYGEGIFKNEDARILRCKTINYCLFL